MVRLFVGSFLKEDEATRVEQFCKSNATRLGALTNSHLRFVPGANLHVTWVFIGEVEENKIPAINKILQAEVSFLKSGAGAAIKAGIDHNFSASALGETFCLDVDYDYLEAWPDTQAGRVLVATPTTVPDPVLRIGMALRNAMKNLGQADGNEPRNKLFRPHITLARLNPPGKLIDGKLIKTLSQVLPVRQRIDSLDLIQSSLGQKNSAGEAALASSLYEIVGTAF